MPKICKFLLLLLFFAIFCARNPLFILIALQHCLELKQSLIDYLKLSFTKTRIILCIKTPMPQSPKHCSTQMSFKVHAVIGRPGTFLYSSRWHNIVWDLPATFSNPWSARWYVRNKRDSFHPPLLLAFLNFQEPYLSAHPIKRSSKNAA